MVDLTYDIRRLLKQGVRIVVDPRYIYVWRQDGVIKMYRPDRWRAIYIAPDDDVICEQRPRKGVVFRVTRKGVYATARVRDCLGLWI